MLIVSDNEKGKLIAPADFWQLVGDQPYQDFRGVSFVSSVKFIEEHLLPQFANIELILGLSDNGKNPIGQKLSSVLFKRKDQINYAINHADSEFTKRILDGSLKLYFTKTDLIHSKIYLMQNDDQYRAFTGSMNLTEQAVHHNFEQLEEFYGDVKDIEYRLHRQMFDLIKQNAAEIIDAKQLRGYLNTKDKSVQQVNILKDGIDLLQQKKGEDDQNYVLVNSDEIKRFNHDAAKLANQDDIDADTMRTLEVSLNLFTDKGNLKRQKTIDKKLPVIQKIQQKVNYIEKDEKAHRTFATDSDYFPRPLLIYSQETDQLYESPKFGSKVPGQLIDMKEIDRDHLKRSLQTFCDIINEYQDVKINGEGWQALNFLLYLYESPFIWQIKDLYAHSDTAKHSSDVPVAVNLVGRGQTGKTTLGIDLAGKLTGALNTLSNEDFKAASGSRENIHIKNVLNTYYHTKGPVSPLMIDDVRPDLTTKDYFASVLKGVTNKYFGPMPTVILTMNREDNNGQLTQRNEISRRDLMLSFESNFKGTEEDQLKRIDKLEKQADDYLFQYCLVHLHQFFADIDEDTGRKILNDYFYPIRKILKEALSEFGLYDQVKKFFDLGTYNYEDFRAFNDWKMLVSQAKIGTDISFSHDGQGQLIAQINKSLFSRVVADNTNRNSASSVMNSYFHGLPREYEISDTTLLTQSGFPINVINFDRWMKEPLLETRFRQESELGKQESDQKRDEVLKQLMQSQIQLTNTLENEHKQRHHGLFGWLRK
ncbi:phospholipase D family protein [Limosilactobacillus sp.]|uniref:phospholipase D family protein n=1 Tax=Limosilactobacillus sp. TaxID=2773925 RepID=UPI00345EE3A5